MSVIPGIFLIFDGFYWLYLTMKKILLVVISALLAFTAQAQFTSVANGNWNDGATWGNASPGVEGVDFPGAGSDVTIQGRTVTIPVAYTALANLVNITNSTSSILLVEGTLTVDGDITFLGATRGRILVEADATLRLNDGAAFLNNSAAQSELRDGATLEMNYSTGGVVPNIDYQDGSTLAFTNYSDDSVVAPTFDPGAVSLYNVVWNCPAQGTDLSLEGALPQIRGSLTVSETGTEPWYLFLNSTVPDYALSIGQDFTVQTGAAVVLTGHADFSETETTIVNIDGNLNVLNSGTEFYFTQGDGNGIINLSGNFTLNGSIVTEAGAGNGNLNFVGATTVFTRTGGTLNQTIHYNVGASTTLDLGTSALSGTGSFVLNGDLIVRSNHASGAIQNTTTLDADCGNLLTTFATRSWAPNSTIIYEGSSQTIGSGHPSTTFPTVHTTINSNVAFASTNNAVAVTGTLHLAAGNLTIGNNKTLTLNGAFTRASTHTLVISSSSNITVGGSGAFGTLFASGSSTINNLTLNRGSQTVTLGSNLTVGGTLAQTAGNLNYAGRTLTIANNYSIGVPGGNLTGDASSTLIVTGIGTVGTLPLNGTIGTLEINRESGAANTTSVTVATALNLLGGVFGGSGAVTLSPGITVTRGDGSTTKTFTVSNYNLVYSNGAPIDTGNELILSPSTALNNLTISGSSPVTLNGLIASLTINGVLTLSNGEFITNSKPVFLEGNFVSNATGTFTGSLVTFSGNSTLSGGTAINLDDVEIETGSTLNLGSVDLRLAGDFTPEAGAIMQPGTASTFFNGTTVLTLPDNATQIGFNNLQISSGSSLTITCIDCGSENNRPAITVAGTWITNAAGATFDPAPNIGSNIVTGVRFTGATQSITLGTGQSFWDLRLAGTGTVTLQTDLRVSNDLELEGTKTLSTGTNRAIAIGGDFLFDGGSFTANQNTVTFNGTANQIIDRLTGSGTPSFFNITINKAGGSFTNATNVNLTNIFTISSNTAVDFDGPNPNTDVFTLVSTSSRTAIVAAILSPADPNIVTGSVTAQRYMDGEGQIYRYIAAPVTNPQVVDLQGEISVTGSFTGTSLTAPTNCLNCAPCTGCPPSNAQSMFRYNGALAGTVNQRYEDFPATANTETMAPTRGYTVFVREASNPTTWNLRGLINRGSQTFTPLAFTGVGADDSYNLVGNPYPSPIDWFVADAATTWTRTNIDPTIYTWDHSISNYATYNRMTNTGTNGGSRYVAVGQAFWIRTTAGGASMIANEGAKSSQQPTFFREKQPEDYLRMKLLASNGNSNEALVHFNIEGGSDNFDNAIDSYSFPDAALKFFTFSKDARPLAINVLGALDCTKEISVSVGALQPGNYSIQYSEFESFTTPVNIQFLDRYTGNSFVINSEKSNYEFNVTTDTASFGSNRFRLIFSNQAINLGIQATAKNSCVGNEAQVSLATSQPDVIYFVSIGGTKVSEDMQGNGSLLSINIPGSFLTEGDNPVVLMAKYGSCDAVPAQSLKVNVGPVNTVTHVNHGSACQPSKITLTAAGAQEGGTYRWYESPRGSSPIEGATDGTFITPELQSSKSYYVSILNPSGCESERVEVKVEITALDPAEISVEGNLLRSNHEVGNRWLKDGEFISEEATVTTSTPAAYTLEVRAGECLTTASYEHDLTGIQIFPNPANELITINVESSNEIEVDVYNSMGVRQGSVVLKPAGTNRRTGTFDLSAGASGMYLIQIKDGAKFHQKKILKK
jgi:hypothetical protein